MDLKEIKKLLKSNLSLLKELDYSINIVQEGSEIVILLFKQNSKFVYNISLPFIGVNSNDVGVSFSSKEIEEIIQPILKKAEIRGGFDYRLNQTCNFFTLEPDFYEKTKINSKKIKSEKDISNILKKLKRYVIEIAEPFFEKWSDLKILNNFFDEIPQKEVGKYFGQNGIFKKAIVYKLCNNPKFEEYFSWLYTGLVEGWVQDQTQDIIWKKFADAVIELNKILKIEQKTSANKV